MIEVNYNEYKETLAENMKLIVENGRLNNIIKEVREWIRIVQTNEDRKHFEPIINTDELDELLEILDKEKE